MTSWALAGELKLPHFTVQLHSLITKYMGETAAKLLAVFESMRPTRGVVLFDKFDAIGSMRAGTNDVGEIRRVLSSQTRLLRTTFFGGFARGSYFPCDAKPNRRPNLTERWRAYQRRLAGSDECRRFRFPSGIVPPPL